MKKIKFTRDSWFSTGELSKNYVQKCRDSMKRVVTLAKIQIAKEGSLHLNLMDNFQKFY